MIDNKNRITQMNDTLSAKRLGFFDVVTQQMMLKDEMSKQSGK